MLTPDLIYETILSLPFKDIIPFPREIRKRWGCRNILPLREKVIEEVAMVATQYNGYLFGGAVRDYLIASLGSLFQEHRCLVQGRS
ncbi:MAG: hypothetical protein ACYCQJ_13175 [Nitrososphaerales archaeon]